MRTRNRLLEGVIDEVRVMENKISISVNCATYVHGKHSWRVEGPSSQDVTIAQLLSQEIVEYIRNRKDGQNRGVAFSFWYNITDVASEGEKNKARQRSTVTMVLGMRLNLGTPQKPEIIVPESLEQ